jgi:probable HAF family extracellular repeat protein
MTGICGWAASKSARVLWGGGLAAVLVWAIPAEVSAFAFVPIDVPGATLTVAHGINGGGQLVGFFETSGAGAPHGFLDSGGSFTPIDVPGAPFTIALGINTGGQIVGQAGAHGFLDSGGSFASIDVPGAGATAALGINTTGQIVGEFTDATSLSVSRFTDLTGRHGFLESGGSFTLIDVPGALGTIASGINDLGQIVGAFTDAAGKTHGFLESGGSFLPIDVPVATTTGAFGVNDLGQIVGNFSGVAIGPAFLDIGGTFSLLAAPGAITTGAFGINDAGQIVGDFSDLAFRTHGYLATSAPEPTALLLLGAGLAGLAALALPRTRGRARDV